MIRGNALCLLVNKILAITCWVLRRLNIIVFSVKFRNQMRNKTQESLLIFPHGVIRPKCIFFYRQANSKERESRKGRNKQAEFLYSLSPSSVRNEEKFQDISFPEFPWQGNLENRGSLTPNTILTFSWQVYNMFNNILSCLHGWPHIVFLVCCESGIIICKNKRGIRGRKKSVNFLKYWEVMILNSGFWFQSLHSLLL